MIKRLMENWNRFLEEDFEVRGYVKPIDSFHTLEEWKEFANKVLDLQEKGQSLRAGKIEGEELQALVNNYYQFQREIEVDRYELLTDKNVLDHIEDFANHRVWSIEGEYKDYFPDMSNLKFAFFYSRGDLEPYVLLDENYTDMLYGSTDNPKELYHYTSEEGLKNIQDAIDSGDTFDISSYTVAKRPFFRTESDKIITFLGNVRAAFKSDVKSFAVEGGRRAANMYRLNYPGEGKTNICMDLETDCANGMRTSLWNEIIATPIKIISVKERE